MDKNLLDPADLVPYLEHVTHMDLLLFLRMLQAAGDYSADEFLSTVDVPVLVMAGMSDTFTPYRLAQEMAKALPKSELVPVPSGTHVAPLEQRDLVGKRVAQFLARAHVIRRRFLLAAGVLAVPHGVHAANGELSDLKWTGKAPTFPLFRAVASGDFRGEVEARITTKSEPIHYRKYLAYYRLAEALGSKLVPRTECTGGAPSSAPSCASR